ncbi:MAG TPA: hypothetical protein VME46_11045, partial [Acidimicrobiales bacterium]|nr:hypothetical protein [Acidimicrobiales bacterium]
KDVDLSRLLISVLLPYAATEGTVRQALMDVAASSPRAELAGPIIEALGELLRWGPELLPWFLAVYRGATSDQVKATALAALAGGAPGDERLYQIYAEATASPDPRIRSWGVLGLLMVPMTEDRASLVAAGAPALTVPSVDVGLRRALARKLACLPTPPEGLRVALEQAAAGADDGTIRQICRQALSRAPAEAGAGRAELERWHHQVDVDEDVSGIFPDVFALYGAAPALAAEVLKTCVLNPACRDKLYYQRYQVNDILIMQFLAVHGAFDDDLCRYCAAQVTGSQGPSAYLAMLRWRPSYPGLRDMVWQALESAAHPSGLNHRLLLEVMVLAHGSDEAAAAALEERLGRLGSPTAAARYMRFLDDIHFWPPAERVISGLLSSGRLLDEANTQALKATITDLFPGFASLAAGTGPGLADG